MATLPAYTGNETQDRANIAWLQNPNFNTTEIDTAAAERAFASGTAGSQFGSFFQPRLRDEERIKRFTLANQMLQPYLEREQQAKLEKARQAAEDARLATAGQQAMQRLQAEQQGAMQRMTVEQRNLLARQAAEGQQAMERLQFTEGAASERQQAGLAADMARFESGQAAEDRRLAQQLGARSAEQERSIESQFGLQSSQNDAALQRQVQAGQQAMQQLQAEQEGRLRLQDEAQRAQLQRDAMLAQQAILELQARALIAQSTSPAAAQAGQRNPRTSSIQQAGMQPLGYVPFRDPTEGLTPPASVRPNASTLTALNEILRQYSSSGGGNIGRAGARELYRGR